MKIRTVGILGAGTMGSGIAQRAAQAGFNVILVDRDAAAVTRSIESANSQWRFAARKGRIIEADAERASRRLQGSVNPNELGAADLAVEAVYEDFAVKRAALERLSSILPETAVIGTNTSSFRVDDLAKDVRHPARFLGLHFFVPAQINRLLEVVRGSATDEATIDRALAWADHLGKEVLLCRDGYGFAVNRYFVPCANEAVRLVDEGAAPERVNAASRAAFGAALGVLSVMNLSKARVCLNAARTLGRLGPFYTPADGLVRMGEANGEWFLSTERASDAKPDPAISNRLSAAVFLAVLEAIDDRIAEPAAFDLGARHGLRWRRAPCAMMDELGMAAVESIIRGLPTFADGRMPRSLGRVGRLLS